MDEFEAIVNELRSRLLVASTKEDLNAIAHEAVEGCEAACRILRSVRRSLAARVTSLDAELASKLSTPAP